MPLAPEELATKIETFESQINDITEKLSAGAVSPEDQKAMTDTLEKLQDQVEPLTKEREDMLLRESVKSMNAEVTTLREVIEELRKPTGFEFAGGVPGGKADSENPYESGKYSFYADVKAANKGNQAATERLTWGLSDDHVKAMTEGTDSAGGYLVNPEISNNLIQLRQDASRFRGRFSQIDVTSDGYQIPSVTGGLTAGWVAELAEKPSADLTFGQVTASIFTAAGLAIASNQLLADAPGIDGLVNRELAQKLATVEEVGFINGSGTGQPLGILNTPSLNTITNFNSWTVDTFLDTILDGIGLVQDNFYGEPDTIGLHPRVWRKALKFRNADSNGIIVLGGQDITGRPVAGSIYGVPVALSRNIPTNINTDQAPIIIGKFDEALILDRQGITVDESEHVYFTSNRHVFRGEERVGFTAGRYPKAFTKITGTALAP